MSAVLDLSLTEQQPARRSRVRGPVWNALLGNWVGRCGLGTLVFFVVLAIVGPWIAPYGTRTQLAPGYQAPSPKHWLGLDDGGIDVLSLMLSGIRISMLVGTLAALVALLIGGTVGMLAGYFGTWIDTVLMRITDYFIVLPAIPLMIVAAAVFGRSLTNVIVIIGLVYWTTTARLIRAQVKSVREQVYVRRAQSLGARDSRLILKHVLPQVVPLLIANAVLMVANAIFAETYVSFLGLGDPSTVSLGRLIENSLTGGAVFHGAWWAIVPPGLCVTVLVLACTLLGQALEENLNPRLSAGHLSVRRFRVLRPGAIDG